MMFTSDQYIDSTIEQKSVYYTTDDKIPSGEPHYFVVLNVNPEKNEVIYLACATSKIHKALSLRQNLPVETVVRATTDECAFLTKESAFDCNSLFERTLSQLKEKREAGKLHYKGKMPDNVFEKIKNGVLSSPLITEKIKKMLRS